MKLLICEPLLDKSHIKTLLDAGIEPFMCKEDVENVHEFDREALLATLKDVQPDTLLIKKKFIIDKEIIDSAPLKMIATQTTGLDKIDLDYCREKKIEIISLRGSDLSQITAVAEWTIGNLIQLMRIGSPGYEIKGKTLGVWGWGRIGKQLTKLAESHGMNVVYYDIKYPESSLLLDHLLKMSDVLAILVTADESNRNMVKKEHFEKMKSGTFLVNPARPWLVDFDSLKWGLENKLNGAWFDFELPFKYSNLLTSNHRGGDTFEALLSTEKVIISKIIEWLKSY